MAIVEEVFGSKERIKILRVMSECVELKISDVVRKAGMNHSSTERHLEKLKEMGLVGERRDGPIRIFEIAFNKVAVVFVRGQGVKWERDQYTEG